MKFEPYFELKDGKEESGREGENGRVLFSFNKLIIKFDRLECDKIGFGRTCIWRFSMSYFCFVMRIFNTRMEILNRTCTGAMGQSQAVKTDY